MNKNIKIAKELVKLAKSLVAGPNTSISKPSPFGWFHLCLLKNHEAFDCKDNYIQHAYENDFLRKYGQQYQSLIKKGAVVYGVFFEIDRNIIKSKDASVIMPQAEEQIIDSYNACEYHTIYGMITKMRKDNGIYQWVFSVDKGTNLSDVTKILKTGHWIIV